MERRNTFFVGEKVKKERATLFKSTYNRVTLLRTCLQNDGETDDHDKN